MERDQGDEIEVVEDMGKEKGSDPEKIAVCLTIYEELNTSEIESESVESSFENPRDGVEQGNETRDVHDINVTLVSKESNVTEKSSQQIGRFFLQMRKLKTNNASKLVRSQKEFKKNVCFKLFRK